MERVMSDEERIKRALEISQRRNNSYYRENTTRVNVNDKKNFGLFKKMILQTLIIDNNYFKKMYFVMLLIKTYTSDKSVRKRTLIQKQLYWFSTVYVFGTVIAHYPAENNNTFKSLWTDQYRKKKRKPERKNLSSNGVQ